MIRAVPGESIELHRRLQDAAIFGDGAAAVEVEDLETTSATFQPAAAHGKEFSRGRHGQGGRAGTGRRHVLP